MLVLHLFRGRWRSRHIRLLVVRRLEASSREGADQKFPELRLNLVTQVALLKVRDERRVLEAFELDARRVVAEITECSFDRSRHQAGAVRLFPGLGSLREKTKLHAAHRHQTAVSVPCTFEGLERFVCFGLRVFVVRLRALGFDHLGGLGDDFLLVVFAALVGLAALIAGVLGILAAFLVLCHVVLLERKLRELRF